MIWLQNNNSPCITIIALVSQVIQMEYPKKKNQPPPLATTPNSSSWWCSDWHQRSLPQKTRRNECRACRIHNDGTTIQQPRSGFPLPTIIRYHCCFVFVALAPRHRSLTSCRSLCSALLLVRIRCLCRPCWIPRWYERLPSPAHATDTVFLWRWCTPLLCCCLWRYSRWESSFANRGGVPLYWSPRFVDIRVCRRYRLEFLLLLRQSEKSHGFGWMQGLLGGELFVRNVVMERRWITPWCDVE